LTGTEVSRPRVSAFSGFGVQTDVRAEEALRHVIARHWTERAAIG
jgi:hypothetical protein